MMPFVRHFLAYYGLPKGFAGVPVDRDDGELLWSRRLLRTSASATPATSSTATTALRLLRCSSGWGGDWSGLRCGRSGLRGYRGENENLVTQDDRRRSPK